MKCHTVAFLKIIPVSIPSLHPLYVLEYLDMRRDYLRCEGEQAHLETELQLVYTPASTFSR